jgi:hypothetical protein
MKVGDIVQLRRGVPLARPREGMIGLIVGYGVYHHARFGRFCVGWEVLVDSELHYYHPDQLLVRIDFG